MRTLNINHSVISSEALADTVQELYDCGLVLECRFLNNGLNDTYLLKTAERNYVVRIYKAKWRTKSDMEFELELLNHLAGESIPVSVPIPLHNGELYFTIDAPEGERFAVLFSFAAGGYSDSEDSCRLYGAEVARMHGSMNHFRSERERFQIDLQHLLAQPLLNIRPFLSHRPDDMAYLESLALKLESRIRALSPELEWGACHGDLHGSNVYFHESGLTHFDFDCCGFGWRAYDLAVFLWAKVRTHGKEKFNSEKWSLFLESYQRMKELSMGELAAIPVFVAIREIWLMGLHTGFSEVWGGWMDDHYFNTNISFLKNWCEVHEL